MVDEPYEGLNLEPPDEGFDLWRHRNAGRLGTEGWSGLYGARKAESGDYEIRTVKHENEAYSYPGGVFPKAAFERLLSKNCRLRFVPGERASYSNPGYLVLGEVISEVSGMGYEEYVREEILRPLGMVRTGFSYPEGAGDGAATGYQPLWRPLAPLLRAALPGGLVGPRQGRYVAFNPFYVKGPAYGGPVGGVDKTTRLVMLHLNGGRVGDERLLSPEWVAEMQQLTPRGGKRDFGLGWFRARKAGLLWSTSAAGPVSGT